MFLLASIALAVVAPEAEKPWEMDWPKGMAWGRLTSDGDRFWVMPDEVTREGQSVAIWMHGEHSRNTQVKYRTSLWRFSFYCNGQMVLTASTTRSATGETREWDGFGGTTHIRPGTIYQELERKFCIKQ